MKNWVWLLIGLIGGGMVAGLIVVFVAMPFALGHRNDLLLEKLYADAVVSFVSRTQAGSVSNATAQNPRSIETGRTAYTGSCAVCHGANGDGKGAFGAAMYPPASDLTAHDTQEKSDAQLFWIIKKWFELCGDACIWRPIQRSGYLEFGELYAFAGADGKCSAD